MAIIDTDQGWFKFANKLCEAQACAPFTSTQHAIFLVVMRQTYGRHGKLYAKMSVGDIAATVGANERNTRRALDEMIENNVLRRNEDGLLGIQKDPDQWGQLAPFWANSPGRVRPSGRARAPENEGESARKIGRVSPVSSTGPKTERQERQERQATRPKTFEEIDRENAEAEQLRDYQELLANTARAKAQRLKDYNGPPATREQIRARMAKNPQLFRVLPKD